MRRHLAALILVASMLTLAGSEPASAGAHPEHPTATPVKTYTLADYYAFAAAIQRAKYRKAMDYMAALARQARERAARKKVSAYPHGLCGGDLPTCAILRCESRGDIHAQNPRSSASGKWQILTSTWSGFHGYSQAKYAPERDQDDKARILWDHGRGRRQWSC